jgi:hypothetical protein
MPEPRRSDPVQILILILAAASVIGGLFLFYGATVRGEDELSARISVLEAGNSRFSDALETGRSRIFGSRWPTRWTGNK